MIIEEKNVREYRRSNQNGQPRETGNIGTQDEEKQNKTQQNIFWTPLYYYNLTILICFFISLLICNILLSYIFRATI